MELADPRAGDRTAGEPRRAGSAWLFWGVAHRKLGESNRRLEGQHQERADTRSGVSAPGAHQGCTFSCGH